MSLGIMGEYLGRIYSEIKGRPVYLVRNAIGLESDENAARLRKSSQLVLQEHEGWN
jgi:dolichol-phosphate mannosyltransferase